LTAIHKLHDQRVLSDKCRLVAASARLQTNDPSAHEKFQALVETCAGKSQRNSVNSANGSLDKDDLEDDSQLERHSSYSTTSGSAEIEQDSRSSHDMKDTGIDVERPHHILDLAGEPSRKPFNSSPDLNLNLDSNDSYNPDSPVTKCDTTLTTHMAGLHVAKPGAPPKILGVEVDPAARIPCIPPFPHHFYGPSSDVQSPSSRDYISNSSVLRPSPLQADAHTDPTTRLSESSFGAETSASGNQSLENYSRRVPLLFNSKSSFSTTSTANTYTDSLRDSSATPAVTVARGDK
jgi:hypothetical protein